MNNINLVGRLTRDVELRTTQSGVNTARFTVAVDREGNKDKTDFIPCVAWRSTADFIAKYFHKGSPISITGALHSETYEKDGENRTIYQVNVEKVRFVPRDKNVTAVLKTEPDPEEPKDEFEELINDDSELPF